MRRTYKLSRAAEQDLQQIADYWTFEAGEEIALQMVGGILETILTLSTQPRAGRLDANFGAEIRKFAHGDYMIYYRARKNVIEIAHVFDGRRDQAQAWRSRSK